MNKISRKGFLKIAVAAAMSGVTAGALAACNSASSSTASGAAGQYIPGTYEGTAEGISSTVKVTMTFSDSAVTDVVVDTSGETASFGAAAADELREQLLSAGSAEIDGVSGSTITSDAVMKAAKSCYAQAKGEAVVSSVQLPTGDANDWLGKEPDIDETAITETVDTDILIVGAGNGGMFAAAYAAANGLNFRVIEQNANVQDTRHWYGAVDSAAAKEAGEPATDKAKLLSEISRYASGKCDQRVVKTWINESAAMHDFMRSILEDKYGWVCDFTSGSEAAWPAENAEHNTDYLYPVQEHNYMASESASGLPRNELLLQYIQELGYDVDFKTSLAKLEKNSDGRITGIIAQSTEDDHFIRYNANKGVLLACGGFPGNPYMMEQLDPLGTSVTTACSYSPADKGYGIRAAVWAGANLDKEAAPMLFDRGIVAPGVDAGYVDSDLIRVWINESGEMVDWLTDLLENTGNYYMSLEAGIGDTSDPGRDKAYATGHSPHKTEAAAKDDTITLNSTFQQHCDDLGVEWKLSTSLVKLEQDENGKVTGIIAQDENDQHYIRINASKGVIICAGGYACNTEMMQALQPQTLEMKINYSLGSTCDGSGIKAMMWAGAGLDPTHASMMFNRCCCLPTETAGYKTNGKWFWFGEQPFLKVNLNGKRFCNESGPYEFMLHSMEMQPYHTYCDIFDA